MPSGLSSGSALVVADPAPELVQAAPYHQMKKGGAGAPLQPMTSQPAAMDLQAESTESDWNEDSHTDVPASDDEEMDASDVQAPKSAFCFGTLLGGRRPRTLTAILLEDLELTVGVVLLQQKETLVPCMRCFVGLSPFGAERMFPGPLQSDQWL
ncbi:hypothetical protein WJX77_003105 [Trebouxia sp. C0004]